jgi:hypothetical protein
MPVVISTRTLFAGVVLAMGLHITASDVSAQLPPGQLGQRPISRPTQSPYLNLLNNNGANPALNYYNFVQPEQRNRQTAAQLSYDATKFSNKLNSLQTDLGKLQKGAHAPAQGAAINTGRMPSTGHATTYGSTSGYFPTSTLPGR